MGKHDKDQAAKDLQSDFPGITIDYRLSADKQQIWEERLPTSLTALIRALLDGFLATVDCNGKKDKTSVSFFSETSEDPDDASKVVSNDFKVLVNMPSLKMGNKQQAFSFNISYKVDVADQTRTLYLETVVAPGRGRQFIEHTLLPQAEGFKARKLALSASAIGGSQEGVFAWARYGFVPIPRDWDKMRAWGAKKVDDAGYNLSAETTQELKSILSNKSPSALRRVVYLNWQQNAKGGAKSKFLDAMLTSNVSWYGELDLSDAASAKWLTTYLTKGSGADSLPLYEPLLPKV